MDLFNRFTNLSESTSDLNGFRVAAVPFRPTDEELNAIKSNMTKPRPRQQHNEDNESESQSRGAVPFVPSQEDIEKFRKSNKK